MSGGGGSIGSPTDWVLTRLQELRAQHAEGEVHLADLRQREAEVHDSLLRLAGAIHVLEELVIASGAFATGQPSEPVGTRRG